MFLGIFLDVWMNFMRIQVYDDFLTSNSVNIGIKPPNPWLPHIIFCLIMKIYWLNFKHSFSWLKSNSRSNSYYVPCTVCVSFLNILIIVSVVLLPKEFLFNLLYFIINLKKITLQNNASLVIKIVKITFIFRISEQFYLISK